METKKLDDKVKEIVTTTVFNGKNLETVLETIYTNILKDRAITEELLSTKTSSDDNAFLDVEKIKQLQNNSAQLIKFAAIVKDIVNENVSSLSEMDTWLNDDEKRRAVETKDPDREQK
jgi:hypothetical protein